MIVIGFVPLLLIIFVIGWAIDNHNDATASSVYHNSHQAHCDRIEMNAAFNEWKSLQEPKALTAEPVRLDYISCLAKVKP
jgi:hypothetical protein